MRGCNALIPWDTVFPASLADLGAVASRKAPLSPRSRPRASHSSLCFCSRYVPRNIEGYEWPMESGVKPSLTHCAVESSVKHLRKARNSELSLLVFHLRLKRRSIGGNP